MALSREDARRLGKAVRRVEQLPPVEAGAGMAPEIPGPLETALDGFQWLSVTGAATASGVLPAILTLHDEKDLAFVDRGDVPVWVQEVSGRRLARVAGTWDEAGDRRGLWLTEAAPAQTTWGK